MSLQLEPATDTWVRFGTCSDLPPPPRFRDALQFLFYKLFTETHCLGCSVFRAPQPERNVSYNLRGVNVVLNAKFQRFMPNLVVAHREHRHTLLHIYILN